VVAEQVPETGLHQELTADPAQCAALAALAGVPGLSGVRASFDLRRAGRGRIHVVGRVTASVGQICVVTLEPMESAIDEPVDVLFAPEDQVETIIKAMENEAETDGETPDPPEPIVGGQIDLGKLAADVLFLAIDPYPRKPGAVFEPPMVPEDPESHPFAALKALKGEADKTPDES
jgi:uncharacterized metal-binding protein YceD (DUF177 family)